MPKIQPQHAQSFLVERDLPLIGVVVEYGDREVIAYSTDEESEETVVSRASVDEALRLLGAWKDIDTDDALDQLDRIRRASQPTPPIDL
jgi:hypothetical protein